MQLKEGNNRSETNKDFIFFEEVAQLIGGNVTSKRVERVIQLLNEGHILHGVKHLRSLQKIEKLGILPLTPEGGGVSYWTSGTSVFGTLTSNFSLQTYDSTFFHYAHASSSSEQGSIMIMALTNQNLIGDIVTRQIRPNDYLAISNIVPRERLALLFVEVNNANHSNEVAPQIAQEEMFNLLEVLLLDGYHGKTTYMLYL